MIYVAILRKHGEGDLEYAETEDLHKLSVIIMSWGYAILTPEYEIEITVKRSEMESDRHDADYQQ